MKKPSMEVQLQIIDHTVPIELDTTTDKEVWAKQFNPELREPERT